MTKNVGNTTHHASPEKVKRSPFAGLGPALFPLAVVAICYLIGKRFFGF
jgi:hypothetical protein